MGTQVYLVEAAGRERSKPFLSGAPTKKDILVGPCKEALQPHVKDLPVRNI